MTTRVEEPALDGLIRTAVDAAEEVHRRLGPDLGQSAYEDALCCELVHRGIGCQRRVNIGIYYRGVRLATDCRVDVCVAGRLAVDVLTVEGLTAVHRAALRSRLRITGLPAGAAVNFRVATFSGNVILLRRARSARERDNEREGEDGLPDPPTPKVHATAHRPT
jgi:GxxExxY protein